MGHIDQEETIEPREMSPGDGARQKNDLSDGRVGYQSEWHCLWTNTLKGGLLGVAGKVFLNSLFPFFRFVRRRKVEWTLELFMDGALRHGLFLGSLLGIYNTCLFHFKRVLVNDETFQKYKSMIAGALAGVSLFWVPRDRRGSLLLLVFVRAFEMACRMCALRGWVPTLNQGDLVLMGCSAGSIVHSYVYNPDTIDKSYTDYLDQVCQIPRGVVDSLGAQQIGLPLKLAMLHRLRDQIRGPKRPQRLYDPLGYDKWTGGELLHPTRSIMRHFVRFFLRCMVIAVPMYFPVFAFPVVTFRPKTLVKTPFETFKRIFEGTMRSSVMMSFVATFIFCNLSVLRSIGCTYKNLGKFSQIIFFLSGASGGIPFAIEKKSRRIEIGLMLLSKAIEARWSQAVIAGIVTPKKTTEVLIFMSCFGIIAHAYSNYPDLLRKSNRTVLSWFLDDFKQNHHKLIF